MISPDRTMSAMQLEEQSIGTANYYMQHAVDDIDKLFGEGYAKAHPQLIAAYMEAASKDFRTAVLVSGLEDLVEAIYDKRLS